MSDCKHSPNSKHEFHVIAQFDGAAISKCLFCGMAYEHYLYNQREEMKGQLRALLLIQDECPKCKAPVRENQHFRTLKHNNGCSLIPYTDEVISG